jgi:putative membrane protein
MRVPAIRTIFATLLLATLPVFATAALAAGPTPAEIAASASVPTTAAFVATAPAANAFEIASSRLALEKSTNPTVRAFAERMITDHTKIGEHFVAAFGKANTGLTPPDGLGPELGAIMDKLQGESGAAFDKDYIVAQTKGHQAAVGLFAGYAKGGDNAVLKAFASETLPIIEMHLEMCYALGS